MTQAAKHIKCNHSHRQTGFMVNDRQDPTRTLTLRNRYARQMKKRFRWLRGIIRDAVVEKDVFGIAGGHEGIAVNKLQVYADSGLHNRAFDFPRQSQKVNAFMEWLQGRVDRGILETRDRDRIGESIDQTWQNIFLEDSYKRGVIRGNHELIKGGFPGVQSIEARGGVNLVMGLPMHVDRLGVLYTRAFNDLKGITDAMDTQISRVLVQGLADGDGPRLIARKLSATVGGTSTQGLGITDTLGRFIPAERRAEILARTEIIRAHHHGMMQEYRNWGVEGVSVQAEFRTAGDDRVCPDCEGLEGQVYSLDEAQNLIPVHPMCRCIVLPFRPGTDQSTATDARTGGGGVEDLYIESSNFDISTAKGEKAFRKQLDEVGFHFPTGVKENLDKFGNRVDLALDAVGNQVLAKLPKIRNNRPNVATDLQFFEGKISAAASQGHLANYTNQHQMIRMSGKALARTTDDLHLAIRGSQFNVGTDLKTVMRHEYAHFVHYRVVAKEFAEQWTPFFNENRNLFKTSVSRYSSTNAKEGFAEAFAAYTSPKYRRGMLPESIESKLESIIGRRVDL